MKKIILLIFILSSKSFFSQKISFSYKTAEKKLKFSEDYYFGGFQNIVIDKNGDFFTADHIGVYRFFNDSISLLKKGGYGDPKHLKLDMNKNLICYIDNLIYSVISKNKNFSFQVEGSSTNPLAFDRDNDNILWYSTYDEYGKINRGLSRMSANKTFTNTNSGLLDGYINLINCDRKGNVWILLNNGLSKYDGTNWTNYTSLNSNFPSTIPSSFIIDSIGNLWFGSNEGVTKFDGKNWIKYNTTNSSLVSNNVNKLALDFDNKTIWIGTKDGISKFDGNQWQSFNKLNTNLPVMWSVMSMSPDKNGNLWFSSIGDGGSSLNVLCKKINNNIFNDSIQKKLTCNNEVMLQTPSGGARFYWSTGDTVVDLKVTKAGNYSVLIYDSLGCPYSKSITVNSDEFSVGTPSICMVTTENSATKLVWNQTTSNIVSKYNIYRQSSENSTYEKIHEQKLDVLSEYIDNETNPNIKTYRYKISYVDTCGNETPLSDNHATILLSSNVGINGTVNLFWNPYEGFTYPNFEIWRSTDGVNFIKIGAVANNSYAYIDNNPPSIAWYQIRITKQDACLATKRGENYVGSNIISKEGKSLFINEQKNESFTVYPNPTKDLITINNVHGNTIRITDIQGKEVYNALATSARTEISLKTIGAKGMYILHIVDEKGVSIENKKIVLE